MGEADGATFRQELGPLDNVFFLEIAKQIYAEFGIFLNEDWFEKHVYANFLMQLPDFVPEGELSEAVTKMTEATILFQSFYPVRVIYFYWVFLYEFCLKLFNRILIKYFGVIFLPSYSEKMEYKIFLSTYLFIVDKELFIIHFIKFLLI